MASPLPELEILDKPYQITDAQIHFYLYEPSYMLARVGQLKSNQDWNTWCPGTLVGEVIDSPLNPVLYSN